MCSTDYNGSRIYNPLIEIYNLLNLRMEELKRGPGLERKTSILKFQWHACTENKNSVSSSSENLQSRTAPDIIQLLSNAKSTLCLHVRSLFLCLHVCAWHIVGTSTKIIKRSKTAPNIRLMSHISLRVEWLYCGYTTRPNCGCGFEHL